VNTVFNTAVGDRTTLNDLVHLLKKSLSKFDSTINEVKIIHGPQRDGDIPHSLASIEKAKSLLGYQPKFKMAEGIEAAINWYWENI
jgi:UDP-N-acetylglucosamine 4-epimerase